MSDLHVHTIYCDGKSTPEEMVLSAIEKGLKTIGVLGHSYVEFDLECCVALEKEGEFIEELKALKEKYKDKIEVLCGIEQDYFSKPSSYEYDYKIGSVHYFLLNGKYYAIDQSYDDFVSLINSQFNGDYYLAAELYYDMVSKVIEVTKADIIAHIDLITKFNEGDRLFSTKHPRYVNAWQKAIDKLLTHNIPFEINTGVISRGYKSSPYPSTEILAYLKERGAKFIMNSDAHHARGIAFEFDKWKSLL